MNRDVLFSIWAPDNSPWSRWAKPVLFAHYDPEMPLAPVTDAAGDVSWAPPVGERVALVLDLPGAEGVQKGLALAACGFRPVPLYNAVPLFAAESQVALSTNKWIAAVNVLPILSALKDGAEELAKLNLPADAPPAFLLDANRAGDGRKMAPDDFDNRSVSFTTDFPSANFLLSQGISNAILVQRNALPTDLAHIMRRWQDGGLALESIRLGVSLQREILVVPRPSWYRAMFQRMWARMGLRRAEGGGFGDWVPGGSSGG
jgi:hypothetical protein